MRRKGGGGGQRVSPWEQRRIICRSFCCTFAPPFPACSMTNSNICRGERGEDGRGGWVDGSVHTASSTCQAHAAGRPLFIINRSNPARTPAHPSPCPTLQLEKTSTPRCPPRTPPTSQTLPSTPCSPRPWPGRTGICEEGGLQREWAGRARCLHLAACCAWPLPPPTACSRHTSVCRPRAAVYAG